MAQLLALLALLRKLLSRETGSFASVGLNNFLFCILFLMSGSTAVGRPRDAFWSTLLFQLLLLAPLLVTFSIDTQHRLPATRVAIWPLTTTRQISLSLASFALNPSFLLLFVFYTFWMGAAIGLCFLLMAVLIHLAVYAAQRLPSPSLPAHRFLPNVPVKLGGIMLATVRELAATLDLWTALLIAIAGSLYRLFGHAPEPDAFPVLSLFVAVAMSTIPQRLLSLNEGRATLRYKLLPIAPWKLLAAQDLTFLALIGLFVLPLNLRAGVTFSLVAVAIGRYPSLKQHRGQRRWRFIGGDPRFGAAQVVVGLALGLAAARVSFGFLLAAAALYLASLAFGQWLWNRSQAS